MRAWPECMVASGRAHPQVPCIHVWSPFQARAVGMEAGPHPRLGSRE